MKLQFNSTWAHPVYNARIGEVVDVVEQDLVDQLVDGGHARPYVPASLVDGAKPDAATEARIKSLEALVDLLASTLHPEQKRTVREIQAQADAAVKNDDAALTFEPAAGPFAAA